MTDLEGAEATAGDGRGALLSNASAVRAVVGAVEGTFGPKGLDCMLVGPDGEVVLTNDGVTILRRLEVVHPAGRLLVQAAEAQERMVGDGTTTAAIVAGALIGEGAGQILRGVPVSRVICGIQAGMARALSELASLRRPVEGLRDPVLDSVALVAARGDSKLARSVMEAAVYLGEERLRDDGFQLAESVLGLDGADDAVLPGVVVEREPVTGEPRARRDAVVALIEGALEPARPPRETPADGAGGIRGRITRSELKAFLERLAAEGVTVVLAGRGMDDEAVQFMADRDWLGLRRVPEHDLRRLAALTGAKICRHFTGQAPAGLGRIARVEVDPRARLVRFMGGPGSSEVTIVVGGHTGEIVGERERIARDAASSVQHAFREGVVPGGGAVELALARALEKPGFELGLSYGVGCVRESLKRPLAQLAANAGYDALEKVEMAYASQVRSGLPSLGIDPDTGEVCDQISAGIWDPYPVKVRAMSTALEVAVAVLRVNNILKMRAGSGDGSGWYDPA